MSVAPMDQAARLRSLMNAPPQAARTIPRLPSARPIAASAPPVASTRARIIAIASGKGGVGKTNIAVNLAIALSRRGSRVLLVDADLGTANVGVLLNVQSRYDLSHVIRGERTIDEISVALDVGPRLIRGASGLSSVADIDAFDRQRLVEQLERLEHTSDIILLDCGAGISQNVAAFARAADDLLIVTTPEPTALTDAYALVKVLALTGDLPRMGTVVNQAGSLDEGNRVAERIAEVADRFLGLRLEPGAHILRDEHVARAVCRREAFFLCYPHCAAATCITALAKRFDSPADFARPQPGFFRRMAALFY